VTIKSHRPDSDTHFDLEGLRQFAAALFARTEWTTPTAMLPDAVPRPAGM
jgi:hypothetical protein